MGRRDWLSYMQYQHNNNIPYYEIEIRYVSDTGQNIVKRTRIMENYYEDISFNVIDESVNQMVQLISQEKKKISRNYKMHLDDE